VIESLTTSPRKPWTKSAARTGWTLLILTTLYVSYFSHLGAVGFVGPDEPRYAWIARDMAETGDWVTPRLYGKPWFEKPPLYYWGAAESFKLFGVSEAAARLPSAISALLLTLALAWLALRLYGPETALWLLLLLPTSLGMVGFSHAAATDMPFSGMLTLAMVFAAVPLGLTRNENTPVIPRTPWLALTSFGFFLGLAVLAKGPAAILLCGGAVFFWAIFSKSWRDAFRLFHPAAIVAFCLTALPWYILCARRNPDFFRIFIIEHNFKRFLTPEFQHVQPFWFYGPILILAVLPWSATFLWAAITGGMWVTRNRRLSRAATFFSCWITFCLVFFSLSQSKLPGYILPAIPPILLVLARSFVTWVPHSRRAFGAVHLVFGLGLLGVAEFLGALRIRAFTDSTVVLFVVVRVFLLLAIPNLLMGFAFWPLKSGRIQNSLLALAMASLTCSIFFADRILEDLQPIYWREKDVASQLLAHGVPRDRTYLYLAVNRNTRYALSFYLHRELLDWDQNSEADGYVVSGSVDCSRLRKRGFNCEEVPLGASAEGWSVSHVTAKSSANSPASSGQPQ
jgi:4-amino-4-deoxy-L-arabinose transferase-like glycosyltransferase